MTTDPPIAQAGEHENRDRRPSVLGKFLPRCRPRKAVQRHAHFNRAVRDALDGLPLEKFRRVCGLFDAVVPATAKAKNQGSNAYVDPVVQDFQDLRARIEKKLGEKDRIYQADDLGHDAHNLQLLLGELLPAAILENALPSLRDDYRNRVSAEVYAAYLDSEVYQSLEKCGKRLTDPERLELLRADYVFLINEVRRLTLLEYHIEEARSFLIRKLRWTLFKLLAVPLFTGLFLACRALIEYVPPVATAILGANGSFTTLYYALVMATLLGLAAMVGATGSFVSALLRIEAVPENTEIGRSVVALRSSESIRLAPVTGFIFAILLSLIFGGRLVASNNGALISGGIFPDVPDSDWPLVLFFPAQLAKWLAWSFIVGFSERLMPDMIDRLVARADKSFQEAPPSVARGGGGGPRNAGPNGAAGNGTHRGRGRGKRGKATPTKPARTPAPATA